MVRLTLLPLVLTILPDDYNLITDESSASERYFTMQFHPNGALTTPAGAPVPMERDDVEVSFSASTFYHRPRMQAFREGFPSTFLDTTHPWKFHDTRQTPSFTVKYSSSLGKGSYKNYVRCSTLFFSSQML